MTFSKRAMLVSFCLLAVTVLGQEVPGQTRQRIVSTVSVSPSNPSTRTAERPASTRSVELVRPATASRPVVKNTSSSNLVTSVGFSSAYDASTSSLLIKGIQSRWGTPYRRGTAGPDRFDCSGFVWSVFRDSGFEFTRSSARTYWDQFEPVEGPKRFTFGTLVFFNNLGHVGIVADEHGFYHASTSQGVIYSPFKGYWENRIDGFRKVPAGVEFIFEYGEN